MDSLGHPHDKISARNQVAREGRQNCEEGQRHQAGGATADPIGWISRETRKDREASDSTEAVTLQEHLTLKTLTSPTLCFRTQSRKEKMTIGFKSLAGRGEARRGKARLGEAWRGAARPGMGPYGQTIGRLKNGNLQNNN